MTKLDPRVRYAAQRTLLAWIRTGLAMMGFGFVLARFSLFIKEMASTGQAHVFETPGLSLGVGVTLLILGSATCFISAKIYAAQIKRLEAGLEILTNAWPFERILSIILATLGIFMAGYLLSLR
ncbi:MAG: DUF202 domain-containing protein [Proteobacteria bacterium]|nr:MAG: DUF202 domain-containing protein [Pseudomonadota bacterium]